MADEKYETIEDMHEEDLGQEPTPPAKEAEPVDTTHYETVEEMHEEDEPAI